MISATSRSTPSASFEAPLAALTSTASDDETVAAVPINPAIDAAMLSGSMTIRIDSGIDTENQIVGINKGIDMIHVESLKQRLDWHYDGGGGAEKDPEGSCLNPSCLNEA